MVWRISAILLLTVSIACGQGAQGVLRKGEALGLSDLQEKQIREILNKTVKEYNDLRTREQGSPGLSEKLRSLRKGAEDKSLDLLTLEQRKRWNELAGKSMRPPDPGSSTSQPAMDGSLLIPTIEELRNPPRSLWPQHHACENSAASGFIAGLSYPDRSHRPCRWTRVEGTGESAWGRANGPERLGHAL